MGRRAMAGVVLAAALVLANASAAEASGNRETDAARHLMSLVPTEIRPSCRIVDLQQSVDRQPLVRYAKDISVAVQCVPPDGADAVTYVRATSAERANHLYDRLRPKRRLTRSDKAADCEAVETYSLGADKTTVGHDACYFETNVFEGDQHPVAIDWTYEPEALYVRAVRNDGDAGALRDWWSDVAGPLEHAQPARIPEAQNADVASASYRTLLSHLPAAVRSTCHRASLGDDAPPSVADDRVWLDAAADCKDRATGVESSFVHFTWNAPLDAEFRRISQAAGGDQTTASSGCPSSGTWQHDGVDVGPFVCAKLSADVSGEPTDVSSYVWADPADRIFAVASVSGDDATRLESWWRAAGPIPS